MRLNYFAYRLVILFLSVCNSLGSFAQQYDTIQVTSAIVNTQTLIEGTHRYLVYFKTKENETGGRMQLWSRKIEKSNWNGKNTIVVTQIWEDKDTVIHSTKSVCDAKTMQPLFHQSWWKHLGMSIYDFEKKKGEVNGYTLNDADTSKSRTRSWVAFKESLDKYVLNWHLDLEVFPLLPFKENAIFSIPYYDPGSGKPKDVVYTVTGSGKLEGYNKDLVDCWLLLHESKDNKEIFWISKKTHEVLKLEQLLNGNLYRYKIKLPFNS